MGSRIFFSAVCAFWVTMNYLLWRSEFDGGSNIGALTPVKVVWNKILTAPDNSSLEIFDHERRIGFCHWTVTSGEAAAANRRLDADYAPDGAVVTPTAYALSLDGNVALAASNRVRFDARLTLATNQDWRSFHLRAGSKPTALEIEASAASRQVRLGIEEYGARFDRSFTFEQLANPQALLEDAAGPAAAVFPGVVGLTGGTNGVEGLASALRWRAQEDHMQFGHSRVRVYRMEADWMGRRVRVFVSLVGEILWVDLPGGVTFRNEAFDHF